MTDAHLTLAPGRVIGGKYRLERLLGEGGMGAVYAAENLMLRAPVAIKVLHPELSHLPDILNRFTQEAQAAAQVRHANIVSVLDFGRDDETEALFLVQEFLVGADLKQRLRARGAMAPREAIELLLPLMRALAFAHAKGVVHRDLKPDNIFLCDGPGGVEPKLIDFGIAKVFDAEGRSVQKTRTAQTLGTPHYMSPEQARGDATVDHRTDIWSLGVVLYQMLTLRHPYEGESANEIIGRILFQAPTRIEVWRPELPRDVVALVDGAIQQDPARRYPTMDAFAHAARACAVMEGPVALAAESTLLQPSPTPAPRPTVRAEVTPASSTDAPRVFTAPPRSTDGGVPRRRIALIAASCVVAVGGVFAALSLRSRAPEPPARAAQRAPVVAEVAAPAATPPSIDDASSAAREVDATTPPDVAQLPTDADDAEEPARPSAVGDAVRRRRPRQPDAAGARPTPNLEY